MKKLIFGCLMCCALSSLVFAESSKITKVDLDVKTTHLIKADLGRDDLFYYMDLTACVCWVSQSMGSSFSVSTFDCSKLEKHPRLEKYVAECGIVKKEESPKKEEVVEKTNEAKKEDVKPEGDVKQSDNASFVVEDKATEPTKKEDKKSKK
jgi:hypothetical protein